MTNTQHTPAPWHIADYKHKHPERIYDDIYFGNNKQNTICRLFTNDAGGHETQQANARLIAAAPELLRALEIITDYIHSARKVGLAVNPDQILIDAAYAITRATGKDA